MKAYAASKFESVLCVLLMMTALTARADQRDFKVRSSPIRVAVIYDRGENSLTVHEYFSARIAFPFSLVPASRPLLSRFLSGVQVRTAESDKIAEVAIDENHVVIADFDGMADEVFVPAGQYTEYTRFALKPNLDPDLIPRFGQAQSLVDLAQAARLFVAPGLLNRFSTGLSLYEGYFDSRVVKADYESLELLKPLMTHPQDYQALLQQVVEVADRNIGLLKNQSIKDVPHQYFQQEINNAHAARTWALNQSQSASCENLLINGQPPLK